MQLDQTHVVVRVRTLSEIGDLALILLHKYPSTLLVGFLMGAWPWMVINALLLYWIPLREAQFGLDDQEAATELARYTAWMALLVFLQAPAAGVLTTIYLGQAVFEQKPSWKSARSVAREQLWPWLRCLVIQRLAALAMLIVGLRLFQRADWAYDVLCLLAIFFLAIVIRSSRPYLPEMILLEKCPLRTNKEDEITLSRRARALHRPVGSDVGSRWLSVALTLCVVFAGLFYSLVWVRGIATGYWNIGLVTLLVLYPLALWIVAGLSVIVRMIAYLDTRIRLEGWDVELAVRAEAIRQFGEEAEAPRPSHAKTPTSTAATPDASVSDPSDTSLQTSGATQ